jgi:signal peptidase I
MSTGPFGIEVAILKSLEAFERDFFAGYSDRLAQSKKSGLFRLKRMTSVLGSVAIVLLAVAIAGLALSRVTGVQMRAVISGSMRPKLPVGSLVVIVPTPQERIQVGDDISYVRDESLMVITHRVIAKDAINGTFTTQGLANNMSDAPVKYGNVLGVVRASVPAIGYLLMALDSTKGKVIALTLIAAIWVISILAGKIAEKQNPEDGEARAL